MTVGEVWEWRVGHFWMVPLLTWKVAQGPVRVFVDLTAPDLIGETEAAK